MRIDLDTSVAEGDEHSLRLDLAPSMATGTQHTLSSGLVRLTATDDSTIRALAGGAAGAGTTAIGAALGTNDVGNSISASIHAATISSPSGTIQATAASTATIQSITIGGAGAGTFALGGSVSLNEIDSTIDAHVGDGAILTSWGQIDLKATDGGVIQALAGGAAGAGSTAIGAAVATNEIGNAITASVEDATVTSSGDNITVDAQSTSAIDCIAVGGAGAGTFALGGSVSWNHIHNTIDAHISTNTVVFDAATNVDAASDFIDMGFPHGFTDGQLVFYSSGDGDSIGGLQDGTTYYVIRDGENTLRLAEEANGEAVDLDPTVATGTQHSLGIVFDATAVVDATNDVIDLGYEHGLTDGQPVVYHHGDGEKNIGGLADGQTYYVIAVSPSQIKLAASEDLATSETSSVFVASGIDGANDTISFGSRHGLKTGDRVVYHNPGSMGVGLTEGESYYVIVVDSKTIALAISAVDAEDGNRVDLTDTSQHFANANVQNNTIEIAGHGFDDGQAVKYLADATAIGGLENDKTYYVIVETADAIKLAASQREADERTAITLDPSSGFPIGHHLLDERTHNLRFDTSIDLDPSVATGATLSLGVLFDGTTNVDRENSVIDTGRPHGFEDGEEVVYHSGDGEAIGGLADGETYTVIATGSDDTLSLADGDGNAIDLDPTVASGTVHSLQPVTGQSVVTSHGHVSLTANDTSTIRSLAGGVAGAGSTAIGAAVAGNKIANTVDVCIEQANVVSSGGNVELDANSTAKVITLTVGGAGAGTFALGGSASLNEISNSLDAHISKAAVVQASEQIGLSATDHSAIKTLAGGVAGAGGTAIGAALATNDIANALAAYIDDSTVTSTSGTVALTATATAHLDAISAAGAFAGTVSLAGSASLNEISNTIDAYIHNQADVKAANAIVLDSQGNSRIRSLAGTVSGAGTVAIGAALATNDIGDTVRSYVENATANADHVGLSAVATADLQTLSAGVSGSGTVSIAGAVSLNDIHNTVDSHIADDATVTANENIDLLAQDNSTIQSLAGQISAAGVVAIGGSAAYNEIHNTVKAYADHATLTSKTGNIILRATSNSAIKTVAAGGSFGIVGIAGSVAINLMENDVDAHISDSQVDAQGTVLVLADSVNTVRTWGGTIAVGAVGIGGTAVINTLDNVTRAHIDQSDVAAKGSTAPLSLKRWDPETGEESVENISGLAVVASSTDDIEIRSGTAAIGVFGVAGNVSVNTVNDTTEAFIVASAVNTPEEFGESVKVIAQQNTDVDVFGGALAKGGVVIAGAVDTTFVSNTTWAFISDAEVPGGGPGPERSNVYARDLEVLSLTRERVTPIVAGAAISKVVSLAGSVSVVNLASNNAAFVKESDIFCLGSITVDAEDNASVETLVGSVSLSLLVGAGASIAVNSIENTTRAELIGAHTNATGATEVVALSNESIITRGATIGAGLGIGLAGAVSVNSVECTTEAQRQVRQPAIPDQPGSRIPTRWSVRPWLAASGLGQCNGRGINPRY